MAEWSKVQVGDTVTVEIHTTLGCKFDGKVVSGVVWRIDPIGNKGIRCYRVSGCELPLSETNDVLLEHKPKETI